MKHKELLIEYGFNSYRELSEVSGIAISTLQQWYTTRRHLLVSILHLHKKK